MPLHYKEYTDRILRKSSLHAYQLSVKKENGLFGEKRGMADFGKGLRAYPEVTTQVGIARPFGRKRNSTGSLTYNDNFANSRKKPQGLATADFYQRDNLRKLTLGNHSFNAIDKQEITQLVQKRDIISTIRNANRYSVALPGTKPNQQMQLPEVTLSLFNDRDRRIPQSDKMGTNITPVLADLVKSCNFELHNSEASEIHINRRRVKMGFEQLLPGVPNNSPKISDAYLPNNGTRQFFKVVAVEAINKLLKGSSPISNQKRDWSGSAKLMNAQVGTIRRNVPEKAIERNTGVGSLKNAVGGFKSAGAYSSAMNSRLRMLDFLSNLNSIYGLQGIVANTRLQARNNSQGTLYSGQEKRIDSWLQVFGMKGLFEMAPQTLSMLAAERNTFVPGLFNTTAATRAFNPFHPGRQSTHAFQSQQRSVHIHMNRPLIENFSITSKDAGSGIAEFRRKVEEVLLEILNSANATR